MPKQGASVNVDLQKSFGRRFNAALIKATLFITPHCIGLLFQTKTDLSKNQKIRRCFSLHLTCFRCKELLTDPVLTSLRRILRILNIESIYNKVFQRKSLCRMKIDFTKIFYLKFHSYKVKKFQSTLFKKNSSLIQSVFMPFSIFTVENGFFPVTISRAGLYDTLPSPTLQHLHGFYSYSSYFPVGYFISITPITTTTTTIILLFIIFLLTQTISTATQFALQTDMHCQQHTHTCQWHQFALHINHQCSSSVGLTIQSHIFPPF